MIFSGKKGSGKEILILCRFKKRTRVGRWKRNAACSHGPICEKTKMFFPGRNNSGMWRAYLRKNGWTPASKGFDRTEGNDWSSMGPGNDFAALISSGKTTTFFWVSKKMSCANPMTQLKDSRQHNG
jgi:hypothetical protein